MYESVHRECTNLLTNWSCLFWGFPHYWLGRGDKYWPSLAVHQSFPPLVLFHVCFSTITQSIKFNKNTVISNFKQKQTKLETDNFFLAKNLHCDS